jgi:predicted aspartyl protease
MGLTRVAVRLLNSDSSETYHEEFLVDTGAMDSVAPGCELRKIGIKPVGKKIFELADGQLQEWEYGLAEFSFMNHITAGDIVFGPDNIEPLLGVVQLESAGFIVDPKNQRLMKLRALPLKMAVAAK